MMTEEQYLERRVLRTLLRLGKQKEGKVSNFCRRSIFMPSWQSCVARLLADGKVSAEPVGHGHARFLELTPAGVAAAEREGERMVDEILAGEEGQ